MIYKVNVFLLSQDLNSGKKQFIMDLYEISKNPNNIKSKSKNSFQNDINNLKILAKEEIEVFKN